MRQRWAQQDSWKKGGGHGVRYDYARLMPFTSPCERIDSTRSHRIPILSFTLIWEIGDKWLKLHFFRLHRNTTVRPNSRCMGALYPNQGTGGRVTVCDSVAPVFLSPAPAGLVCNQELQGQIWLQPSLLNCQVGLQ